MNGVAWSTRGLVPALSPHVVILTSYNWQLRMLRETPTCLIKICASQILRLAVRRYALEDTKNALGEKCVCLNTAWCTICTIGPGFGGTAFKMQSLCTRYITAIHVIPKMMLFVASPDRCVPRQDKHFSSLRTFSWQLRTYVRLVAASFLRKHSKCIDTTHWFYIKDI